MMTGSRVSHFFFWGALLLVVHYDMETPFLTILFASLALKHFAIGGKKWISVTLFLILVYLIFQGFAVSLRHSFSAIPSIVAQVTPKIQEVATMYGIDLPWSDVETAREAIMGAVRKELGYLTNFAKLATKEFATLIIGLVVAVSMYVPNKLDMGSLPGSPPNNLYTVTTTQIRRRFRTFFESFETVLGAQIIISAINSLLTGIFVFTAGIKHPALITVVTFLCGLLPIIGNLISNTIIAFVALTESLRLCVFALVFLIVIHKLEYFLNSKIIGSRIKNPMWMTLIALVIGEEVAGIPGMILAPVVLHYLKVETSRVEVPEGAGT